MWLRNIKWVGLRFAIAHYGDGGDARVCPTDSRWADSVVAKTANRVTVRNGVGRFHLHSTCCNVGKTHAPYAYVTSVGKCMLRVYAGYAVQLEW